MCFTLRAPARLGAARRFIPLMENHIGAHRTMSYDTLPPLHSPLTTCWNQCHANTAKFKILNRGVDRSKWKNTFWSTTPRFKILNFKAICRTPFRWLLSRSVEHRCKASVKSHYIPIRCTCALHEERQLDSEPRVGLSR